MTELNYTKALAWRKAHLRDRQAVGQLNDARVTVFWPSIPLGGVQGCRDWLRSNRSETTELQGDHQTFSGLYRLVRTFGDEHRVVAEYALDHDSSLDWTNARIDGGHEHAPGDKHLVVRFPSIDYTDAATILASVRNQTYTNPTIGDTSFTGTYQSLAARVVWNEDKQAADLLVVIGDPDFSMTAFQDYGLPNQKNITYLWNIPKAGAQAVVDGYKSEGYTVSVSHSVQSDVEGTVDIVISANADITAKTLDTVVAADCDTTVYTYYRWGLTESELATFLTQYSVSTTVPGVKKQLSVSYSADTNKYNVVYVESHTTFGNVTLVTTVGAASRTTRITTYRWNLSLTEVEDFAALYSDREAGKKKSVSVSRKANECVYDVIGVVEEEDTSVAPLSLLIGNTEHVEESREYRWHLTLEDVQLFAASYTAKEPRVNKRVDVSYNAGDDLYSAIGVSQAIDSSSASATHGTYAEQETFETQFSLGYGEMQSLVASLGNDNTTIGNRSISVSRTNDDTYNVSIRIARRKGDSKSFTWTVGTVQNSVTFYVGQTPSEVDVILAGLSTEGYDYSLSMGRSGDGTWDMTVRQTYDPGDNFSFTIGNIVGQEAYQFYYDITEGELLTLVEALGNDSEPGSKRVSVSRRDGKYNVIIVSGTAKEAEFLDKVVGVGGNYTDYETTAWGKQESDLPTLTLETGKAKQLSYSRDADGYVTYRERERDTAPFIGASYVINRTPDGVWTAYNFRNLTTPPTLSTSYGRISCEWDPDTNTYSGTVVEIVALISSPGTDQWDNYEVDGLTNVESMRYAGSETRIKTTYSVKQTRSLSSARNFADDSSLPGSGVSLVGDDKYRAIKVTAIEVWNGSSWAKTGSEMPDWSTAEWLPINP